RLTTDIDDMDGESLAAAADELRARGALDVVLVPTIMKKGRPGVRVDVLASSAAADALEAALFAQTSAIGVPRTLVERHALPREERTILVLEHAVRAKFVTTPDGVCRGKAEFDDLVRVAKSSGVPFGEVQRLARDAVERVAAGSVGPTVAGAVS